MAIDRRALYKYDQNGCAQASRTQFPLTPCYATTVHKAHRLTMDAIVVHCCQEFVSGQTYVAISRAREEGALHEIGFKWKFLLLVPTELLSLANVQRNPNPTLHCCRNTRLDDRFFEGPEECESHEPDEQKINKNTAKNIFETNSGAPINLNNVISSLFDCKKKLAKPPNDFSIKGSLQKIVNGKLAVMRILSAGQ